MFDKTVIVGVGLLGSSLGMNLVSKKLSKEVIGVGRDHQNLKTAQKRKALHRFMTVEESAKFFPQLTKDDLVVLASPVSSIKKYLALIPSDVLITDVGSVKGPIMEEADRLGKRFVGAHPIAGTEKSGAKAGDRDLFKERLCVITPSKKTRKSDVLKIKKLWTQMGSRVRLMSAVAHDRLFGYTSHLPHALAYSMMASDDLKTLQKEFIFSSFRDATRVAASSPEMWRDIFFENPSLPGIIDSFQKQLDYLKSLIMKKDGKALVNFLRKGQERRLKL